ncbi:RidA family protein, partial [Ilumatobacter sp.]|uniref:RidA family protein n=1 Tax=Ilumatobacter sp. TaxID=1967498 RepID=UPI003AF6C3F3
VFGMVNSAPGFRQQPAVINGFSDLILDVFGPEVGAHTRSAVGLAELPFGIPVEIEGEVRLAR